MATKDPSDIGSLHFYSELILWFRFQQSSSLLSHCIFSMPYDLTDPARSMRHVEGRSGAWAGPSTERAACSTWTHGTHDGLALSTSSVHNPNPSCSLDKQPSSSP